MKDILIEKSRQDHNSVPGFLNIFKFCNHSLGAPQDLHFLKSCELGVLQ